MLLKVAHALVHGEQVLVIAQNHRMIHSLCGRLNAMFSGCLSNQVMQNTMILGDTGGTVYFASPETLERVAKARAFNAFFSDPGELEEHELRMIAPHIRCVPDVAHFQTEYEQLDFEFPLAIEEDDEPVPVPKESVSAVRRILSSR
jgi:hypothetical protein